METMEKDTLEKGIKIFGAEFMLGTGQTGCFPATNVFKASQHLDKHGNYRGSSDNYKSPTFFLLTIK